MPGNGCGQQEQSDAYPEIGYYPEGGNEHGNPDHAHRDDLRFQRNGPVFSEVTDIGPHLFMIDKPLIESGRASEKAGCCQQQEWSCGQQR